MCKRGCQRLHLAGDQTCHDLDWQGGDVEVRRDLGLLATLLDGDAGEPTGIAIEGLDGGVGLKLDALLGKVLYPWQEPHFACRTAEQAVESSPRQDAEDQFKPTPTQTLPSGSVPGSTRPPSLDTSPRWPSMRPATFRRIWRRGVWTAEEFV